MKSDSIKLLETTLNHYNLTPAEVMNDHILSSYKPIIDAIARFNLTPTQAASSLGLPAPPRWVIHNRQFNEAISYERHRWREAWDITRRDIVEGLEEAIMIARNTQDANAMVKAWTEIGKLTGLYAPTRIENRNLNVDVKATTTADLQRLSDQELHALIAQYEAQAESIDGEVLGRR